jgi:hypothetical protein
MKKQKLLKEVCLEIKKRDGKITPKALVDHARSKDSPIHSLFEWNNAKAAEEYRLWQARELIVTVKIDYSGQEIQTYHNIKVVEGNQGYYHWDDIKKDKNLLNEVIKNAITQLEYWQSKYETYQALSKVINREELEKAKQSINYATA